MPPYLLDVLEVGERAANSEDDLLFLGPRDGVVATMYGLYEVRRCAHCGLEGGH